jgi:hypothetical protein
MQRLFYHILILAGLSFCAASCNKDKGNYSYHTPPIPVVTNLDTLYNAVIGDTLIIQPTVTISDKSHVLGYQWRISAGATASALIVNGLRLQMIYGLAAARYPAQLTIIDSTNGMKYFYPFIVQGNTIYSTGTLVLSNESGVSQLSFVLPNGTIQPRVYHTINGADLPPNAQQIVGLYNQYISGGTLFYYWILCSQGSNPGVKLDPNTLANVSTLKDNFFSTPSTMTPGYFVNTPSNGTMTGVLNGQIWAGAYQTSPYSPIYEQFGSPATGNYQLIPQAIFNPTFPYFLGYDVNRQQVVAFTNFGAPAYIGTGYTNPVASPSFDLTNVGLNMLDFEQINSANCYMFGKVANDSVYELKFGAAFMGFIQLSPLYKRAFPRQDLITADTKWASSPVEIFFFSSGSAVYEYNPLNQSVKPLTTDFGGKAITLLKASADGNTLIVGVDGSVFFLDVSTGKYGNIIRRIGNVPGSPVDIYQRGI